MVTVTPTTRAPHLLLLLAHTYRAKRSGPDGPRKVAA
jgi:hypothetical protein